MRKCFVLNAIGIATIALVTAQPASAFIGNQQAVVSAASTSTHVIEVKRSPLKGRPPGWSHGRKTGWHGHSRPPGQI